MSTNNAGMGLRVKLLVLDPLLPWWTPTLRIVGVDVGTPHVPP